MTSQRAGPTGARAERARQAALAAAESLLAEGGYHAVTIDAVASRSGVARTTIYRHWASRGALVVDVVKSGPVPTQTPNTGAVEQDVQLILTGLVAGLNASVWARSLPSLLDAAQHDPDIDAAHQQDLAARQAPLRAVLARAMDRGDLPAVVDLDVLVSALVGPLLFRRLVTHEVLDADFAAVIARTVLAGARAAADPDASKPADGA